MQEGTAERPSETQQFICTPMDPAILKLRALESLASALTHLHTAVLNTVLKFYVDPASAGFDCSSIGIGALKGATQCSNAMPGKASTAQT